MSSALGQGVDAEVILLKAMARSKAVLIAVMICGQGAVDRGQGS